LEEATDLSSDYKMNEWMNGDNLLFITKLYGW
jgi:hypothetical protein